MADPADVMRRWFQAIEENDVELALSLCREDVEWVTPTATVRGGKSFGPSSRVSPRGSQTPGSTRISSRLRAGPGTRGARRRSPTRRRAGSGSSAIASDESSGGPVPDQTVVLDREVPIRLPYGRQVWIRLNCRVAEPELVDLGTRGLAAACAVDDVRDCLRPDHDGDLPAADGNAPGRGRSTRQE